MAIDLNILPPEEAGRLPDLNGQPVQEEDEAALHGQPVQEDEAALHEELHPERHFCLELRIENESLIILMIEFGYL